MTPWPGKQQWRRWSLPSKVGFIGSVASVLGLVIAGAALLPVASVNPNSADRPAPSGPVIRISQVGVDSQASEFVGWPKPTAGGDAGGGCDETTYLDCQCTYGWHGTDELLDHPKPGRVDAILSVTFVNSGGLPDLLTNLLVDVVDGDYKMGADNEVPIGVAVPAAMRYQVRLKEFGFLGNVRKPGTVQLVPPVTVPAGGAARIELQLMTQEDLATWYVVRFVFGFDSGSKLDTGRLCGAVAL